MRASLRGPTSAPLPQNLFVAFLVAPLVIAVIVVAIVVVNAAIFSFCSSAAVLLDLSLSI